MLSSYCFSNEAQSLWVEEKVRTILCMLCQDEIQAASGTAGGQPKRCNLSLQPVSVTFLLHLPTGNFAVFPLSPFFTQRFDFAVEQQHMLCPKGCETCKVLQEEQQGSLCKKGGFDRGASVTELSHCFFNEGRAQCGLKYHLCVVRVSHWQMPVCAPTQGHRQAMAAGEIQIKPWWLPGPNWKEKPVTRCEVTILISSAVELISSQQLMQCFWYMKPALWITHSHFVCSCVYPSQGLLCAPCSAREEVHKAAVESTAGTGDPPWPKACTTPGNILPSL